MCPKRMHTQLLYGTPLSARRPAVPNRRYVNKGKPDRRIDSESKQMTYNFVWYKEI